MKKTSYTMRDHRGGHILRGMFGGCFELGRLEEMSAEGISFSYVVAYLHLGSYVLLGVPWKSVRTDGVMFRPCALRC